MPRHDALVLAGGRGSRLGGVDKAGLVVAGRPLLERVLAATAEAQHTVVVGPVTAPPGVLVTSEDPPGGGPVAGIAAGLAVLPGGAPWVLVLAVDQPGAAGAARALLATLEDVPGTADAVCHRDPDGHPQWLLSAYRRPALEAALTPHGTGHGVSVRALVSGLAFHHPATGAEHVGDVDTWADHRAWEVRLGRGTMGPPDRRPVQED